MMLALAAGRAEPVDDAADASVVIVKDCLPSLPEILHVSEAGSNPSDAAFIAVFVSGTMMSCLYFSINQ